MRRLRDLALLLAVAVVAVSQSARAAESHRFHYRPIHVGEQAAQQVDFNLELDMTLKQAGQQVAATRRGVERQQRRRVTVLEANDQGPTKVTVTFDTAQQVISEEGRAEAPAPEPVVGKTYIVARVDKQLVITNPNGDVPPPEEIVIVAGAMETIGQPNPMARFFHERTIAVGERVRLPNHLAKELLGIGGALGDVTRLELTLAGTRQVGGTECGVFETELEARTTQGTTMSIQMKGRLLLEIESCRAVGIEFSGPVSLAEAQGPEEGHFIVDSKGQLRMAAQIQYTPRRF